MPRTIALSDEARTGLREHVWIEGGDVGRAIEDNVDLEDLRDAVSRALLHLAALEASVSGVIDVDAAVRLVPHIHTDYLQEAISEYETGTLDDEEYIGELRGKLAGCEAFVAEVAAATS
jgi:hypothetical protein